MAAISLLLIKRTQSHLDQFDVNFEKLAISLSLISQSAVKASIIVNWSIFAMYILIILISKIYAL